MEEAPAYNNIVCRYCQTVTSYDQPAHWCPAGKQAGITASRLTVYMPNTGRVTKNANPAYAKHAGSRPKRFRRTAQIKTEWKFLGDLGQPRVVNAFIPHGSI